MLGEAFFKPRRERRAAIGFDEDVHHLMEEDLGQAALGVKAGGLVQVNGAAAGDGGEIAAGAGGVAEEVDGGILAEAGAARGVQGGAAARLAPCGFCGGEGDRGSIAGGEQVEGVRAVDAPGEAARRNAGDSAGEIKAQNFTEIRAISCHFHGAFLAQSGSVTGAAAAEFGGLRSGFDVIEAAAEKVPTEGAAGSEVERLCLDGAAAGAEGEDAA